MRLGALDYLLLNNPISILTKYTIRLYHIFLIRYYKNILQIVGFDFLHPSIRQVIHD